MDNKSWLFSDHIFYSGLQGIDTYANKTEYNVLEKNCELLCEYCVTGGVGGDYGAGTDASNANNENGNAETDAAKKEWA